MAVITHLTRGEHYREAERLLDLAQKEVERFGRFGPDESARTRYLVAAAQVHATLASCRTGVF